MTNIGVFPDVAVELIYLLASKFPGQRMVTRLPADMQAKTVIRIHRISGANRNIAIDRPVIDGDVFSPTGEDDASSVGRQLQAALLSLQGAESLNGVIQRVVTINGPRWLPEANQRLVRYGATYEVFIRSKS
jgi:hypothetical protein